MTNSPSRREELIAAALEDDLSEDEAREFDRACTQDPSMVSDLQDLQETALRLEGAGIVWRETEPPPGLADQIVAATTDAEASETAAVDGGSTVEPRHRASPGGPVPPSARPPQRGSRTALLGLAAAGLVVVGALGGVVGAGLYQAPPEGPPGTLGAVEDVTFSSAPAGTMVDGSLVAHTWGTETVLEVDGFEVGEAFEVVLLRADGEELTSGTFLGAEETVTCRMNAAVLREDVAQLQIRDSTGDVVVSSQVPEV